MGRYKNNKDGTKTLIAGRGNTDAIESQIGYVEATDTAVSSHAVGSYFINKTGQFVKTTKAIAIGDTISVGTGANDNCVATDIAGVLTSLNSKTIRFEANSNWTLHDLAVRYNELMLANPNSIIIGNLTNMSSALGGIPSNVGTYVDVIGICNGFTYTNGYMEDPTKDARGKFIITIYAISSLNSTSSAIGRKTIAYYVWNGNGFITGWESLPITTF